jgi:hypothetical protein
VVQCHEADTGGEAGEGGAGAVAADDAVEVEHELRGPPRRERVQGVVADVEALDVPGVALLQPFGHARDDADDHEQLRREQQRGRDQERDRRVVHLVRSLGRLRDEELRDRRGSREEQKRRPVRADVESVHDVREQGTGRGDRDQRQADQEEAGAARQRRVAADAGTFVEQRRVGRNHRHAPPLSVEPNAEFRSLVIRV